MRQPAHTKVPARFSLASGDELGGSVPPCRSTKNGPLASVASLRRWARNEPPPRVEKQIIGDVRGDWEVCMEM